MMLAESALKNMKAVENASNTIGSYSKYQDSIQRMKNKR